MIRTMALVSLMAGSLVSAAIGEELVTIKGGADPTCQNYEWEITNRHDSPIVKVEFPHYRADMFTAPAGWESKCTYLVNVGVPDRPGVCTAWPKPPNPGIPKGSSRRFTMRVCADRPPVGSGTVTVYFADGTEVRVPNVTLPEAPAPEAKYIPLVGCGLLFGGWVLVRTWRGRRRANQ